MKCWALILYSIENSIPVNEDKDIIWILSIQIILVTLNTKNNAAFVDFRAALSECMKTHSPCNILFHSGCSFVIGQFSDMSRSCKLLEPIFLRSLEAPFGKIYQILDNHKPTLEGVGAEPGSADEDVLNFFKGLVQANDKLFWPLKSLIVNEDFSARGKIKDCPDEGNMLVACYPFLRDNSRFDLIEELTVIGTTNEFGLAGLPASGVALGAGFNKNFHFDVLSRLLPSLSSDFLYLIGTLIIIQQKTSIWLPYCLIIWIYSHNIHSYIFSIIPISIDFLFHSQEH